ncbi:MAG: cyanophycinase [Planctomycetaceae bacterium]|nr:cyanophycinase [Planctomycetaceae bacterium]
MQRRLTLFIAAAAGLFAVQYLPAPWGRPIASPHASAFETVETESETELDSPAALPALINTPPKGALVISGGSLRYDNDEVWTRFVKLAADHAARSDEKPDTPPRIAVFATGALFPQRTGDRIMAALRRYGADPFLAPVGTQNFPVDFKEAVVDPQVVADVKAAHGVFFSGGQQARIVRALRAADGKQTPVLDAIFDVYHAGGVVGGTSAGAAVMSRIMCLVAEKQLPVLERGPIEGQETAPGLGFMAPDWFIDQHFITRGRFGRALAIMQKYGFRHGLGVDENTALVIQGSQVEIVGYRGGMLIDLSRSTHHQETAGFNVHNAVITYLDRGDRLDLETLEVTPSAEKLAGELIDPHAHDFDPVYDEPIVANDIFANSAVLDVMRRMMDNRPAEAFGLAYDGVAARLGPTPGFEFRLYRDKDTKAWATGAWGGEDQTITNIHIDVRPIEIQGPLYK